MLWLLNCPCWYGCHDWFGPGCGVLPAGMRSVGWGAFFGSWRCCDAVSTWVCLYHNGSHSAAAVWLECVHRQGCMRVWAVWAFKLNPLGRRAALTGNQSPFTLAGVLTGSILTGWLQVVCSVGLPVRQCRVQHFWSTPVTVSQRHHNIHSWIVSPGVSSGCSLYTVTFALLLLCFDRVTVSAGLQVKRFWVAAVILAWSGVLVLRHCNAV